MIPAVLPTIADAAEPAAQARVPKGVPFAMAIEALPAIAAPDPQADSAGRADAALEPATDAQASAQPGAPAIVAGAAALIAQLCPPPDAKTSVAAAAESPVPTCHARNSGNPAPSVEPDPRVRGNDRSADSKPAPRAAKPIRPAGKTVSIRPEVIADALAKAGEARIAAPAPRARVADTTADVPTPVMPAEIAISRHLDLAHDAQWLDRLAQDIARSADHSGNLRFSLAPAHLGRLTVELATGAEGTAVRLTTESEQAHHIVSEAQPRLVAEARAQGLRISETQVDLDQRPGGQQPQRAPEGQQDQDRARPAVLWTQPAQRRSRAAAGGVPAARDLYA